MPGLAGTVAGEATLGEGVLGAVALGDVVLGDVVLGEVVLGEVVVGVPVLGDDWASAGSASAMPLISATAATAWAAGRNA